MAINEKINHATARERLEAYYRKRRSHVDNIKREDMAVKALNQLNADMEKWVNAVDAVFGF